MHSYKIKKTLANQYFINLKSKAFTYSNISFFLVFISCIIYMSNIKEVMDLTLYDEAKQLSDGLNIKKGILPSAEDSPIYSSWYAISSLFINDSIDLYYFNWYFLTVSLPLAIYLLLIAMRLNPLLSFTVSIIFLYSRFNYPLWPKTNSFGILIIIIAALIFKKTNFLTFRSKVDFYTFLFFIGAFIRPEFLVSAVFYFLLNFKNFTLKINPMRIFYLTTSATFISLFGFPFGNRVTAAFQQHFAVNYVERNNLDIIAWDSFDMIIKKTFGDGTNIFDYLLINPEAFLSHIIYNIKRIPISFLSYFKPYNEEFYVLAIVSCSLLFIFSIIINYYRKDIFKELLSSINYKHFFSDSNNKVIISLIIPYFVTAVLIFPRGHYFLYIFIGFVFFIIYNFNNFLNKPFIKLSKSITIIYMLILFSITHVNSQDKNTLYVFEISNFINNYVTVENLSEVTIFSGDGNYCVYVSIICEHNPNLYSATDYIKYLKSNKVDVLIISERMLISNEVVNPGGPEKLINSIQTLQYVKKKNIWATDIYILNK
jgi:hypothetical protein